jgi:phosphopantetheinyl transferase
VQFVFDSDFHVSILLTRCEIFALIVAMCLWGVQAMAAEPRFVEGWRKFLGPVNPSNACALDPPISERIEVWIARAQALIATDASLQVLNSNDWTALDRIRSSSARASAIAARVLLRHSLSHLVGGSLRPADWRFEKTAEGQPRIVDGPININFSVSHTDTIVAVATATTLPVGVDVESLEQNVDGRVVADFSVPSELNELSALSPPCKNREFLRLWTLKEAYTKMIGLGLSADFSSIEFSFDPLCLRTAAVQTNQDIGTRFETLFLCNQHTLHHVSIAIGFPGSQIVASELRVFSLVDENGAELASPVPCVNI